MIFTLSPNYDKNRVFSVEYICEDIPFVIGKCMRYSNSHITISFRINPKLLFAIIVPKNNPYNTIEFDRNIFKEYIDTLTLPEFTNIDFGILKTTTDDKTTDFIIRKDIIQFVAHEYDGYFNESYSTHIYNIRTYTNEIIGDFLTPGFWFF
jgi:hypothetical protein